MRTIRKAVLKAKDRDTVVTGRSVDAPVRCLRNQMTNAYIAKEKEGGRPYGAGALHPGRPAEGRV